MDVALVILLIVLVNAYLIKAISNKFRIASEGYVWTMFCVHFLLSTAYMVYAANTTSDSIAYYTKTTAAVNWLELWGIGTPFIHFLAWPFASLFGLSYYATMIIFSYFGFIAVLLFYITAKENISLKPVWMNLTGIELVFLLPNLHFWSSSLGKGSVILLGLAFFTYGLSRFNRRFIAMAIGGFLTFMIRPHILFTAVVSIMLGVILTNSGIKPYLRWFIFLAAGIIFIYISDDVLKFAETDSLDILSSSSLSHRAAELGKATSALGVVKATAKTV
jgi:hypothetical protein